MNYEKKKYDPQKQDCKQAFFSFSIFFSFSFFIFLLHV